MEKVLDNKIFLNQKSEQSLYMMKPKPWNYLFTGFEIFKKADQIFAILIN
jgi:hypothetical protein